MTLEENYLLSNGVSIPKLGLGTWFISNKNVENAVQEAIKLGYRHIDTAQAYRNEAGVGAGIKKSGAIRNQIFVTSKLDAGIKTYQKAVESIDKSLQKMKLDYLDLMIIHSPQPWTKFRGQDPYYEENLEAWRALEEAYKEGKLKAIGVSNFLQNDLENILNHGSVQPMVNQVLAHIGNTPHDLIKFCQDNKILVEAYSPIAHGELLKHQEVKEIAQKYKVSVPQLSIRYDLQLGLLPLPKTSNPVHMKSNSELDFVILKEDMEKLKHVTALTEYGDASLMPVYGGKFTLRSLYKTIIKTIKG